MAINVRAIEVNHSAGPIDFKGRWTYDYAQLHAVIFSFLTYDNHGHPTPNFANFAGYYVSAAVATSWLPGQHYRTGYTFSTASEQLVLAVPVNLLQEFWPEVRRKLLHR